MLLATNASIKTTGKFKMAKTYQIMLLLVCLSFLFMVSSLEHDDQRDVELGPCNWVTADCDADCRSKGFSGGHCGSFFWDTCWCETCMLENGCPLNG